MPKNHKTMVSPSYHPKSPNPFSPKSPSSSSSSYSSSPPSTMKLKSIFHNLIFTRIHRLLRSFSKAARSFFLEISFKESHVLAKSTNKHYFNNKKVLFDSFRVHNNWSSSSSKSSSHLLPMPSPIAHGIAKAMKSQYRAGYSAVSSTTGDYYNVPALGLTSNNSKEDHGGYCYNGIVGDRPKVEEKEEEELSSYLQWLEKKGENIDQEKEEDDANEIDRLADLFIASCHEKFRLEKIESYRRYHEMLARGV